MLGEFPPILQSLEGPSPLASLLLPPPPSYAPRTHRAGEGPRRQGTRLGSPTGFPGASGQGKHSLCLPDSSIKEGLGASLVAQWLRIHLPMQGTRVQALVWEDPTSHGATKPVRHNY